MSEKQKFIEYITVVLNKKENWQKEKNKKQFCEDVKRMIKNGMTETELNNLLAPHLKTYIKRYCKLDFNLNIPKQSAPKKAPVASHITKAGQGMLKKADKYEEKFAREVLKNEGLARDAKDKSLSSVKYKQKEGEKPILYKSDYQTLVKKSTRKLNITKDLKKYISISADEWSKMTDKKEVCSKVVDIMKLYKLTIDDLKNMLPAHIVSYMVSNCKELGMETSGPDVSVKHMSKKDIPKEVPPPIKPAKLQQSKITPEEEKVRKYRTIVADTEQKIKKARGMKGDLNVKVDNDLLKRLSLAKSKEEAYKALSNLINYYNDKEVWTKEKDKKSICDGVVKIGNYIGMDKIRGKLADHLNKYIKTHCKIDINIDNKKKTEVKNEVKEDTKIKPDIKTEIKLSNSLLNNPRYVRNEIIKMNMSFLRITDEILAIKNMYSFVNNYQEKFQKRITELITRYAKEGIIKKNALIEYGGFDVSSDLGYFLPSYPSTIKSMQKAVDFYPTPVNCVDESKEYLKFSEHILEPTAGVGHIINALRKLNDNVKITAMEYSPQLIPVLKLLNPDIEVNPDNNKDYLKYNPSEFKYDTIFINPPFTKGTDKRYYMNFLFHSLMLINKTKGIFPTIIFISPQIMDDRKHFGEKNTSSAGFSDLLNKSTVLSDKKLIEIFTSYNISVNKKQLEYVRTLDNTIFKNKNDLEKAEEIYQKIDNMFGFTQIHKIGQCKGFGGTAVESSVYAILGSKH